MPRAKDKELHKKLKPIVEDFVRRIDKTGLKVSALIFNEDGFLSRCGNTTHTGSALVKLHYYLSFYAANMEALGLWDGGEFDLDTPPKGKTPLELSDNLVIELMAIQDTLPDRVKQTLKQYAESRKGQ